MSDLHIQIQEAAEANSRVAFLLQVREWLDEMQDEGIHLVAADWTIFLLPPKTERHIKF